MLSHENLRNSGEYILEIDIVDPNDQDITKITLGRQIPKKRNVEETLAYISKDDWGGLGDIINMSPLSGLILNNNGNGCDGSPIKYFSSEKFSKIIECNEDDKIAYLLNVIESTKNSLQTLKQNHNIKKCLLDYSKITYDSVSDSKDNNIKEENDVNKNGIAIEERKKKKNFDEEVKDLRQLYKLLEL